MSFSHHDVCCRTAKNTFYSQIDQAIDWNSINKEITKFYSPGKSATGQAAYPGLLLFKMLLVGYWAGSISDRALEEMANENLSVMRFIGLRLEDQVPDHSVLSRFRTQLVEKNGFDAIFQLINNQLESHGILVKAGVKVDASITDSPRKPKGKTTYEIAEDRKENQLSETETEKQSTHINFKKIEQPGVDTDGRWIKKSGKIRFGYKKHTITDDRGLFLGIETTPANTHDSMPLETMRTKTELPGNCRLYGDKAYKSKKHDGLLKDKKIKNGVQFKASKGKRLTERELEFNRLVAQTRYTVERSFGSMKRWFKGGTAKYVGLKNTWPTHYGGYSIQPQADTQPAQTSRNPYKTTANRGITMPN